MADRGYVANLLNPLPSDIQYAIRNAIWYVMDNWRIGTGARAKNAQLYRFSATTPAVANTEFSVVHELDVAPSTLIPILDLTVVGSQVVPLVVSRAPDATRLYLKSASTNAVVTFLVET